MRRIRAAAVGAVTVSLLTAVTACGGGSSTGGGSNDSPKTLTYWASNQGASIEVDKKVLQPELDKFKKQTGIEVKLEVVPWSDLLNRILTATTSGQGPDVLNIGNTWSASSRRPARCCRGTRRTSPRSAARTASSTPRSARPARRARTRRPSRCTRWRTRSTTTRSCSPTRA